MSIQVEQLTKIYGAQKAIHNISFNVNKGEIVGFLGPNGAGKSTLLKTLVGLQTFHAGSIEIYGRKVRACHHRVAYLPQRGEIDWKFPINVRKFVLTGRYVHIGWLRQPQEHDHLLVQQTLERLNLLHVADRVISDLSGGQQQRALLARAIVQEAELLLLDEPFNNIDPETRTLINTILAELQQLGRTAIVATHETSRLRDEFDFIAHLHEGRQLTLHPAEQYPHLMMVDAYE